MNRLKKAAALFAAAAMILSLAGCAAEKTAQPADTAAAGTAAAETAGTETQKTVEPVPVTAGDAAWVQEDTGIPDTGKADHTIVLSSVDNGNGTWTHTATLDGVEVTEYDYTWNCDLNEDHEDVKNAPAEYFTGTEPGEDAGAVYIAHDIFYYPEIPEDQFKLVNYDGEEEWAVYYPETSEYSDFIFGTLPSGKTIGGNNEASLPTQMMHSAEEAATNAKLHITEPGSYSIEGSWHGQIWIDLGDQDETFTDENAKVKLYLNGADVTCTVAPALVFYSCYECDNEWEDREEYSAEVDTSDAGAKVVLADGTVNNFSGTNIFRMLKTKLKNEDDTSEVPTQKKVRKTDAAFYSYRTMEITGGANGTGVLNVTSGFEGLDSELHLSVNGGNINIYSQDDGINCNEDGVSVVAVNGGNVHIMAGLGSEGDGVDSNGYLLINGGTVISMANPASDSGLDSDCGSFVRGGVVLALGSTMDWPEADENGENGAVVMNLQFAQSQSADEAIVVTDAEGKTVFAYDPDKDEIAGNNARTYRGAVISCKGFETGKEYIVYVGGDVTGTEKAGVYDVSTVTGISDDAIRQGYSGQGGFGGFGGGRPDGGKMQEGMTPPDGEIPSMPENMTPPDGKEFNGEKPAEGEKTSMPENMTPPDGREFNGEKPADGERPSMPEGMELPEDFDPSQMPEGMELPEDFDPSQMPGGFGEGETVEASELTAVFLLEDAVNHFSGVQDYKFQ